MTAVLAEVDPRHGTVNGYTNLRCRCESCRAIWTAVTRARRSQRPPLAPDDPRHGTDNGYVNFKCRCKDCRAAHATYTRALRRRLGQG